MSARAFNPLLHRLFLDYDIFSIFRQYPKTIQKNLSQVLNTFENIMENGAFAPKFPYFQIYSISKASKGVIME